MRISWQIPYDIFRVIETDLPLLSLSPLLLATEQTTQVTYEREFPVYDPPISHIHFWI